MAESGAEHELGERQASDLADRIRFADSTLRPPGPGHHLPDGHRSTRRQQRPDGRPARRTDVDRLPGFQLNQAPRSGSANQV